ncbi:hypothetical protein FWK35_00030348 [Aphis craccivora]
MLPIS